MEVTFAPPRQNEGNFACDILSFEGVPLIAALRVTCSPSALWVGVRRLHFITLSDGCPSVCSDNWSAAGDKQADLGKGRTRGVKAACPEFTQPVHHSTCVSFYGALESRPTHTRVTARSATGLGVRDDDRRRRLKIHILHTAT